MKIRDVPFSSGKNLQELGILNTNGEHTTVCQRSLVNFFYSDYFVIGLNTLDIWYTKKVFRFMSPEQNLLVILLHIPYIVYNFQIGKPANIVHNI